AGAGGGGRRLGADYGPGWDVADVAGLRVGRGGVAAGPPAAGDGSRLSAAVVAARGGQGSGRAGVDAHDGRGADGLSDRGGAGRMSGRSVLAGPGPSGRSLAEPMGSGTGPGREKPSQALGMVRARDGGGLGPERMGRAPPRPGGD